MPVILIDNFHFWQGKNDNYWPFYAILDHFQLILDGHSKMMVNFKILAKVLVLTQLFKHMPKRQVLVSLYFMVFKNLPQTLHKIMIHFYLAIQGSKLTF